MELRSGGRIDRYQLICPIARGGMGAVWLARVQRIGGFDKFFALKVVLPELAEDDRFRAMFLDEARIVSLVVHSNVASIVDVGEEAGTLYLAMEWVDGDSLHLLQRTLETKQQRIPVGIVLRVVAQVCAGLHAVHEARDRSGKLLDVVHRDLSPHNILLSAEGDAKLIDFGIAKARDRIFETTTGGDLKGRARYMAPEQARAEDVDRRADIWAVGAVLYFLLEGKAPFDAENDVTVLISLVRGAPPPRPTADVPSGVIDVVMRCLSIDRAKRYATAADVESALEQAMRDAHLATSTSDVAAFVGSKLRQHVIARKAKIEAALEHIDEAPGVTSDPPPPLVSPRGGTTPGTLRPSTKKKERARGTSHGLAPRPVPPSSAGAEGFTSDAAGSASDAAGASPRTLDPASLHSGALRKPSSMLGRSRAPYAIGAALFFAGIFFLLLRTRNAPSAPPTAPLTAAASTAAASSPPTEVPSSAPAPAIASAPADALSSPASAAASLPASPVAARSASSGTKPRSGNKSPSTGGPAPVPPAPKADPFGAGRR